MYLITQVNQKTNKKETIEKYDSIEAANIDLKEIWDNYQCGVKPTFIVTPIISTQLGLSFCVSINK